MRKIDILVLISGIIGAIAWVIVSGKDGFKANNATIIARSISVTSTIDGQVDNSPPAVGERVKPNELLVRIHNGRFDRSRLVEFESRVSYLEAEIENLDEQQLALVSRLAKFREKAADYSKWLMQDAAYRKLEINAKLEVAKSRKILKTEEVQRASQLFRKKLTSKVNMQVAKIESRIADRQLKLNEAQFKRSELMLDTLEQNGVFFENGDTSYWAKMVNTLKARQFENISRLSTLKSQLAQAKTQADVERERINSSYAEEHRAPVSGVVNASYVNRGTRVTSGTSLYQILDCAKPLIIIPIPDNRISEFSVGLSVTVYPTDSEQALPGKISYVTSGTLIGNDASIQIQQDLIMRGNRAIVSLNDNASLKIQAQSCETARRAVVVIHTKSTFDRVLAWSEINYPQVVTWMTATHTKVAKWFNNIGNSADAAIIH